MDDFAGEFDNHWTLEDEDYEEYIEMDRQNRLRNLKGNQQLQISYKKL